jgi:hypothetical protein
MKYFLSAMLLSAMALSIPATFAEDKPATQDHQIHHPDDQKKEVKAVVSATSPSVMQKADLQMTSMQDIHTRLMNAKTPEERNALMAEQMQVMQDGMAMMNNMSKDAKGMMSGMMMGNQGKDGNAMMSGMQGGMMQHHQMMDKRMDMMQMMMQMMMDRLPAEPKK